MRFRLTGVTALLGVGALLLTACGRPDAAAESTTAPPASTSASATATMQAPAEITGSLSVWAMGNEGEWLKEFVAPFEEAHPGVTVEVTAVPWADAAQKIQTAVAGGQTPDMTLVDLALLPGYVASDGFVPVPDGVADIDGFFSGAQSAVTFDGTVYAVPWYISSRVIFYRTDLAGGLACPADWDAYRDFATSLQKAGAKYGALMPFGQFNAWQQALAFFWQAGGQVTNDDGTQFTLGGQPMVDALTYVKSFVDAGLSPVDGPTQTGEAEAQFVDGTLGAFVSGPWEGASIATASSEQWVDDNVGVCPMPAGASGHNTAFAGGGAFAVFKGAKNPDAAWALASWLAQPETQVSWYEKSSDLPAVQAAWDDSSLAKDPLIVTFGEQLDDVHASPSVATWSQVGAEIDSAVEKVVRGVQSPQDAAAAIQSAAEGIGLG
jgi:multiple sugar transport system substrate-binding protein